MLERKKEKTKEKKDDVLSSVDIQQLKEKKRASEPVLSLLDQAIKGKKVDKKVLDATRPIDYTKLEKAISKDQLAEMREKFTKELPKWVNAPWMFITPKKESQLQSWLEDWSTVLLDYAKIFVYHIININDIRSEHPFYNRSISKRLTLDQIRSIVEYLVEKQFARWLDERRKTRARLYWKSNEEWADELLDFMIDTGRIVEIHSLYDLTTYGQEWSTLPPDDLIAVCQILVDRGVARWLNKEKTIIDFDEEHVF